MNESSGAVDPRNCPTYIVGHKWHCWCEPVCGVCGFRKHTAIHGPLYGKSEGSEPYGHKYKAEELAKEE